MPLADMIAGYTTNLQNQQLAKQKEQRAQQTQQMQMQLAQMKIDAAQQEAQRADFESSLMESYDPEVHDPRVHFKAAPEVGEKVMGLAKAWQEQDEGGRKKIEDFTDFVGEQSIALTEIKDPNEAFRVFQEQTVPLLRAQYPQMGPEFAQSITPDNIHSKMRHYKNTTDLGRTLIQKEAEAENKRLEEERKAEREGIKYQSPEAKQTADLQKAINAGDMVTAKRLINEIEQQTAMTAKTTTEAAVSEEKRIGDRVADKFGLTALGEDAPILETISGYRDVEDFVKNRSKEVGLSQAIKEIEQNFHIEYETVGGFVGVGGDEIPSEFKPVSFEQVIRVNTIAERNKLPSGTKYIGPDNVERVRK